MGCHSSSEENLAASILPPHTHVQRGKSFIKHLPKMAAGSPHNSPQHCASSFTTAEPPAAGSPQPSQHTGWCQSLWGSLWCLGPSPSLLCTLSVEGDGLPASTLSPGTSVWALWPLPAPQKGKGGDKTCGDDTITLDLFFQELPPSNKPLGLPWGEQCRVGVRGGLQSGEQALGTPVFRRGRPQRRGAWRKGNKGENGCSALSTLQARLGYVPTIWNKSSLSRGYFWHTLSSL